MIDISLSDFAVLEDLHYLLPSLVINALLPSSKRAIGRLMRLLGLLLQNEAIRKCNVKEERPK
ncbi:hypothetical protein FOXYSP1_20994 [Fusarium oxysporum f. sp. phaseoli]